MSFQLIVETLRNKKGIEFGGPTGLFSVPEHNLHLYPHVNLDGGNILNNNYFQSNNYTIYFQYFEHYISLLKPFWSDI